MGIANVLRTYFRRAPIVLDEPRHVDEWRGVVYMKDSDDYIFRADRVEVGGRVNARINGYLEIEFDNFVTPVYDWVWSHVRHSNVPEDIKKVLFSSVVSGPSTSSPTNQ